MMGPTIASTRIRPTYHESYHCIHPHKVLQYCRFVPLEKSVVESSHELITSIQEEGLCMRQ